MNDVVYLSLSLAYAIFSIALCTFEFHRVRGSGPDAITIFIAMFLLECCLPGIGIYAALPFVDPVEPTGNWVIDAILSGASLTVSMAVLALEVCFIIFFYAAVSGGRIVLRRFFPTWTPASFRVEGVEYRFAIIIFGGLALTLISFYLSGADMLERYANLIRLRAYSDEFERTELNMYAFELTQSWGWLSIPALFVFAQRRVGSWVWYLCLVSGVIFAVLGVSRRAIFIPILLAYFTFVLFDGRLRMRAILAMSVPIIIWVAYGKEILSGIAFGGTIEDVTARYESSASAFLRASCEQGLTIVESLGTLTLLPDHLRLGVDHLLSIAQRFPHRLLGFDIDYPKRIVRIATEAFAAPETQDIPPGLAGQMWLDFRVFGPMVWGIVLGAQMSVAQFLFESFERRRDSCALVALFVFIIALPINTGSYDFTFAVDVIATVCALMVGYRVRRLNGPAGSRYVVGRVAT